MVRGLVEKRLWRRSAREVLEHFRPFRRRPRRPHGRAVQKQPYGHCQQRQRNRKKGKSYLFLSLHACKDKKKMRFVNSAPMCYLCQNNDY